MEWYETTGKIVPFNDSNIFMLCLVHCLIISLNWNLFFMWTLLLWRQPTYYKTIYYCGYILIVNCVWLLTQIERALLKKKGRTVWKLLWNPCIVRGERSHPLRSAARWPGHWVHIEGWICDVIEHDFLVVFGAHAAVLDAVYAVAHQTWNICGTFIQ